MSFMVKIESDWWRTGQVQLSIKPREGDAVGDQKGTIWEHRCLVKIQEIHRKTMF
jgi:hypothetical protein